MIKSEQMCLLLFLLLCFSVFISLTNALSESEVVGNAPTAHITKGMIIDAGSGGSRLHIYTWAPRIVKTLPAPISFPTADEKFTGRMDPGIGDIGSDPLISDEEIKVRVALHLAPLIDYAKKVLAGDEDNFKYYPIYFKATGGMREVNLNDRERIMSWIRIHMSDTNFCPFFFQPEMARVISGEEEAIFSWSAMNFLFGNLLSQSQGTGEVRDDDVNATFGTLDLGGSSTQIAFYVPNQDISLGLYKLQIGGNKFWNVYTNSFLQFGVNSARRRHLARLCADAAASKGWRPLSLSEIEDASSPFSVQDTTSSKPKFPTISPTSNTYQVLDFCFHSGYSETVPNAAQGYSVEVSGPSAPTFDQLDRCRKTLLPLMEKDANSYCNIAYHGECSIGGAYQPSLPVGKHGHFIGTSSYKDPWRFLKLPPTASLALFEERARHVCSLSYHEILQYIRSNNLTSLSIISQNFCFLSSYTLTLLKGKTRSFRILFFFLLILIQ